MGLFFKKSKNDDFLKPPIHVEPAPDTGGPGRMTIEDVFHITGRGTVVTGRIESGSFRAGQNIIIHTANGDIHTHITGIETFKKAIDTAAAGDNVGIVIDKAIDRQQISRQNIVEAE